MASESAVLLVAHNRLWDAEMLIRSVLEGSYKLAFLCAPDAQERAARVSEYYDDLPEMGRLRTHERLSTLLSTVSDPAADQWRPFRDLILSDEEAIRLRDRYPRKERQALEQKWAFLPIAEALSRDAALGGQSLLTMGYSYRIGSHMVHQDADAIKIVWEREQRSQIRNDAIVLSHAARELSDLFYLGFFRVLAAYRAKNIQTDPVYSTMAKYENWLSLLSAAYGSWHDIEYGGGGE